MKEKTKLVNCPDCNKMVSKNSKACIHCGRKFDAIDRMAFDKGLNVDVLRKQNKRLAYGGSFLFIGIIFLILFFPLGILFLLIGIVWVIVATIINLTEKKETEK